MSSIAPKIVVTGAASFLGAWIVQTLLDRGYRVCGTVPDFVQGEHLDRLFSMHVNSFNCVIVSDIGQPDAFLQALYGADAVIHTAYPVIKGPIGDPNDLFEAVNSATVEIFKTIISRIPTVKRVIMTSSMAAVDEPHAPPFTYTEHMWNDYAVNHCRTNGAASDSALKYIASKTLAEKAAWDFIESNAPRVHFDLVTILPPYILGPPIHKIHCPKRLQFSTRLLMDAVHQEKSGDALTLTIGGYVDVRDLAAIHAEALTSNNVAGRRVITCAGSFTYQTLYDALNAIPLEGVPLGIPGSAANVVFNTYESDVARGMLPGGKFRAFSESAADTVSAARKVMAQDNPWSLTQQINETGSSGTSTSTPSDPSLAF